MFLLGCVVLRCAMLCLGQAKGWADPASVLLGETWIFFQLFF